MATFPRPAFNLSQIITRPADVTAYASGDLVANSTVAGSVTPFLFAGVRATGYKGLVRRVFMVKSQNSLALADFRLHLFRDAPPTVSNGDNGALAVATNMDKWIGAIDLPFTTSPPPILTATGNRLFATPAVALPFSTAQSASLWGLLEARAAYVPASAETIQLGLDIDQY